MKQNKNRGGRIRAHPSKEKNALPVNEKPSYPILPFTEMPVGSGEYGMTIPVP